MKKAFFLCFFILCFLPVDSFGQTEKFVKEHTYRLEDEDSKNTAKTKAQEELRKILLTEVLVYVRKYNASNDLSSADISVNIYKKAITANTQDKLKILDEKFDGFEYYMKGEIEANIADINAYAAELNKIEVERAGVAVAVVSPYPSQTAGSAANNTAPAVSSIQTVRNVTNNAANAVGSVDKAAKALGGLGKVGGGIGGVAGSVRSVKSAVDNTLDAVENVQNIAGTTGGQQGMDAVRNVTNNAANAVESVDKAAKALGGLGKVGGGIGGVAGSVRSVKSAVDNTLDAVENVQNIAGAVKGANSRQKQQAAQKRDDEFLLNFSSTSSPQKTSGGSAAGSGGGKYFVYSMRWEYVAMSQTKGFGGCMELGGITEAGGYITTELSGGNAYGGWELNIGGCFNKDGSSGNYKSVLGFSAGYRNLMKDVRFTYDGDRYAYYGETGQNIGVFGGFWKLLFGGKSNFDITNKFMLGIMRNPVSYSRSSGNVSYNEDINLTYVLSAGYTLTKARK